MFDRPHSLYLNACRRAIARVQPAVGEVGADLFKWPIITQEDEDAVLDTLRNENLSGTNVTREFEVHLVPSRVPILICPAASAR